LRYKANSLEKIVNEIEKLSILYSFIDEKEVRENIVPELEESIFQVIDDILNERIPQAIEKIVTITNEINIYAFYNNLLANLRVNVFIMKLKKEGKNAFEI
jgi:DNA polymerase III delta subunit